MQTAVYKRRRYFQEVALRCYVLERFPNLAIAPTVKKLGEKWHDDKPLIIDRNLIASRHPDDANNFTNAIAEWLLKN